MNRWTLQQDIDMDPYLQDLLAQAQQDYPFVLNHNPMLMVNPNSSQDVGYAETYPVGETGRPLGNGQSSRPAALGDYRSQVGVEVYKPTQFSSHDLAAELLHIDPVANQTRNALTSLWTPEQIKKLQEHFLDFDATLAEGRPVQDAIKNATDAALRTYTTGQGSAKINDLMGYSKEQLAVLDNLKKYMTTPKKEEVQSPFYADPFGNTVK